jgi:hypothetical protein
MAEKHSQKKTDHSPIDLDFSPSFVTSDDITAVVVTVPTNVTEISAHRIVSGQTIQVRFDTSSATIGNTYAISVQAKTTTYDDWKTIDIDLTVI